MRGPQLVGGSARTQVAPMDYLSDPRGPLQNAFERFL